MTDFKTIAISEIRPDPNQPRRIYDESSMDELTRSIKEKGILQPILIRPNGKGYILVCGERRFRAATAAGLEEMPAMIRELSEEEAFELQIIENLQRQDVHPMEEALSYKIYQEKKKVTIEELAAKFAKSKEYIAQRLSFNSLIKEFQTDFYAGLLLIGHAVMLARLTPADQADLLPQIKNHHQKEGSWYDSIDEVKETIENDIMHELGAAPFDKKDEKLIPKAGSCLSCPKRSGSGLLFADVKEKDRCFDPKCYEAKKKRHLVKSVEDILILNPETPVLQEKYGGGKMDQDVNKLLQGHKVKPLMEYDDYDNANASTPGAIKALMVNGHNAGKTIYIKVKGAAKKSTLAAKKDDGGQTKLTAKEIDAEIERIQAREKRSKELDGEKLWTSVKSLIDKNHKALLVGEPLTNEEKVSLAIAIEKKLGYQRDGFKTIGLPKNFKSIADIELNKLFRLFILDVLASSYGSHLDKDGDNARAFLLINTYMQAEVSSLEKSSREAIEKRIERVNKRISDLRWDKKELENKKPASKKPIATVDKKLPEGTVLAGKRSTKKKSTPPPPPHTNQKSKST